MVVGVGLLCLEAVPVADAEATAVGVAIEDDNSVVST